MWPRTERRILTSTVTLDVTHKGLTDKVVRSVKNSAVLSFLGSNSALYTLKLQEI